MRGNPVHLSLANGNHGGAGILPHLFHWATANRLAPVSGALMLLLGFLACLYHPSGSLGILRRKLGCPFPIICVRCSSGSGASRSASRSASGSGASDSAASAATSSGVVGVAGATHDCWCLVGIRMRLLCVIVGAEEPSKPPWTRISVTFYISVEP
ncbi:uncharacterized protein K489DRAFT_17763 [Dissoconium aciculare CBS 342.82]|uniref:Uncharacterized protein n=1 Tax=Dissoconium aciculare CBS 342.82 TaxID=1314786 RepID=A0A6J3MHQ1_9PEZI|nr:uncharacterized protein K489DRAFT_17763 [Dissoconium aciculare CBS 342.82]KAF1827481.1 hypothetical protein K489DRAFT_17763 [Dissoconium aciculare CBS 342.82]